MVVTALVYSPVRGPVQSPRSRFWSIPWLGTQDNAQVTIISVRTEYTPTYTMPVYTIGQNGLIWTTVFEPVMADYMLR